MQWLVDLVKAVKDTPIPTLLVVLGVPFVAFGTWPGLFRTITPTESVDSPTRGLAVGVGMLIVAAGVVVSVLQQLSGPAESEAQGTSSAPRWAHRPIGLVAVVIALVYAPIAAVWAVTQHGAPGGRAAPTAVALPSTAGGCEAQEDDPAALRGFGQVWRENPEIRQRLGCPTEMNERPLPGHGQPFERGFMLRRADTGRTVVFFASPGGDANDPGGDWKEYQDRWDGRPDPDPPALGAPAGRMRPIDSFGNVWREWLSPQERNRLGYATQAQFEFAGTTQDFQEGKMFWTGRGTGTGRDVIWIAFKDGTYRRLPNPWRE